MNKSFLLLGLITMLISVNSAFAQQMDDMAEMNMQPHSKNTYLLMMDTMMVAMDDAPSGMSPADVFMQEMIPHHQGAIEMAKYEIANGKNFEMIQLAKSIMAEQSSEIKQMTLWLQAHKGNEPVSGEFRQAMDKTMVLMMNAMPNTGKLTDTDRAFASVMIPHHQAAIDMARVLLEYAHEQTITSYAKQLISAEKIEIEQMLTYINQKPDEN